MENADDPSSIVENEAVASLAKMSKIQYQDNMVVSNLILSDTVTRINVGTINPLILEEYKLQHEGEVTAPINHPSIMFEPDKLKLTPAIEEDPSFKTFLARIAYEMDKEHGNQKALIDIVRG